MASLLPATMHHLTQHVLTFTTDIPGLHLRPEFAVLVHDPGDGSNLVVRCYGPTLRPSATPIVKASANPTSNTSRPTEYFPIRVSSGLRAEGPAIGADRLQTGKCAMPGRLVQLWRLRLREILEPTCLGIQNRGGAGRRGLALR